MTTHSGSCNGECDPGYYEDRCGNESNGSCVGSPTTCDRVSGACDQCNPRFYGRFCSDQCNVKCAGPENKCSGVNGVCDTGCEPGYYGDMCYNPCNSNCGGLEKTCDRGTGACENCNPGYYGADCSNLCSTSCGGPDHACDFDTQREQGQCVATVGDCQERLERKKMSTCLRTCIIMSKIFISIIIQKTTVIFEW